MKPPDPFPIGPNSNPGIFRVNAHASAKGYKPADATTTFEVTAKNNTTSIGNATSTNATTPLPENNTSSGTNGGNSTSDNNTSTNFNPLIPSSGNFTENVTGQQEQSSAGGGGENNTTASGGNENNIIPTPPPTTGNFSDTGTSHTHHGSKQ
jgi:hypothetical protein